MNLHTDITHSLLRSFIIILMTIIGFLVLAWIFHYSLIPSINYKNDDFMSLYAGGRAIIERLDPYDPNIWRPLRTRLGSTWMPDVRAPFPLWTLVLFVPFSLLDFGWASAMWLATSFLAIGAGLFFLVHTFKWTKISSIEFLFFTLFAFSHRAVLVSMNNGQITSLIFLFLVLFLLLERQGHPFLAGMMLVSVALKPNAFIFFVPSLGLWLLYKQRWSIIAGATIGGLFFLLVSWIVLPSWLGEWMNVRGKAVVAPLTPTLWGLSYELAGVNWPLLGVGFVVITTAGLGWLIFSQKSLTIPQVTSLSLIGSLLITPYAWAYEYIFLLIPAIFVFLSVGRPWQSISIWMIITVLLPWGTYWLATQRSSDTLTVITLLVTGLLYLYFAVLKKHIAPIY